MAKPYYFYVLLCADGTFYGGFTDDVGQRVATHNAGKGAKYTAARRPVRLLFAEAFAEKHDALSAEWHFKHQSRAAKEAFLRAHDVDWRQG
ncbi:GIY-YIG nuclease family protein [Lacticaseibacillus daqingensis]|uniref:GIY-YIG nuclease family protein n=1 Tax=Lacticaseibacillus daqingensis TaxID=2486014 RepID=UPI000F787D6A|nr:GIY-YIG nuclease family protein [Lacticaseibacillus daqingensis]